MKFFGLLSLLWFCACVPGQKTVYKRSLVDDLANEIINAIKNALECGGCETVLEIAKGVAELGDDIFNDVFIEICKLTGAEDDDVCEGTIELEGPILANDLRKMDIPSKTAQLFCSTIAGLCSIPAVNPPKLTFPGTKPPNGRPIPSGQTPIKVVQYSDIHIDPFYETGAGTNCTKPICCRDYDARYDPGTTAFPAGPNGDHKCDAPRTLEESMYAAIRQVAPDAGFTLFTGDIVDHAIWNTTQSQNTLDIHDAYSLMTGIGNIYGTIGNHEQSPTNALQPKAVGNNAQWLYSLLSGIWTKWIGAAPAAVENDIGAYSTKVPNTNLRVISLNTNMYYKLNFWLYEKTMESDPNGQLAWLIQELSSAESAGERVYLIGHMPMGSSDTFYDGSNGFDQIVNRYSATIAAMFFGHTHKDEFQITYSDYTSRSYTNAVAFSYVMPSLTPTDGMPAFRIYSVDPVTFAVLDATTYIADMSNPAFQTTAGPVWTEYYSAKQTYGAVVTPHPSPSDELTPAFWHNVTAAMANDDSIFQAYWAKRTRGWDVTACTGECKTDAICQLQAARSQDNCFTPSPGLNLRKRDGEVQGDSGGHEIHCGSSVIGGIWAAARGMDGAVR